MLDPHLPVNHIKHKALCVEKENKENMQRYVSCWCESILRDTRYIAFSSPLVSLDLDRTLPTWRVQTFRTKAGYLDQELSVSGLRQSW